MRIFLTKLAMLLLICISVYGPRPTFAQSIEEFSLPAGKYYDAVTGVIEWPYGSLRQWDGPIVVLVPPAGPFTRDGWQAATHQEQIQNNSPFTGLSAALRKEGIAVVRFEHPAAYEPHRRCREALQRGEISEFTLRVKCIDYRLIEKLTVARYRAALIRMLSHLQRKFPEARKKMALFGFSEGLVHAAAIADSTTIPIAALVSIGSPAEMVSNTARWQIVERPLEWLPQFDLDSDGVITNEEIQLGYKQGIGNIMSLRLWLSPQGHWDERNIDQLRSRLEATYAEILNEFGDDKELGRLHWRFINDSIRVPYATDSFIYHFFKDTLSTVEIMERHEIPGLFLWGGTDTQVSMARQLPLIEAANRRGAYIQFLQYPERSHLLAHHPDEIWFEPEFAPTIARRVRQFLDDALAVPKYTRQTKAAPLHSTVASKSALTRQRSAIPVGMDFQPSEGVSDYARNVEK